MKLFRFRLAVLFQQRQQFLNTQNFSAAKQFAVNDECGRCDNAHSGDFHKITYGFKLGFRDIRLLHCRIFQDVGYIRM